MNTTYIKGVLFKDVEDPAMKRAIEAIDMELGKIAQVMNPHQHDDRYYTETELNAGQLNNLYYTEAELDAGQLDNRYFRENEHLATSAGAADAGKPIKLNASGQVDGTMLLAKDTPVGTIVAWSGGYFTDGANGGFMLVLGPTNDVAGANGYLNPYWYVCDGATLNDADSPIWVGANRYLPNLTDDRFIMGNTVAGGIGGSNTMAHTHTVDPASVTSGAGTSHSHGSNAKTSGAGTAHAHADTFSVDNESAHTHDISGTSGNASVDHTHSVSGTTGDNNANHTHGISNTNHYHGGVTTGGGNTGLANGASSPTAGVSQNHAHSFSDTSTGQSVTHTHSFSDISAGGSAHSHGISGAVSSESAHTHGYNQSDSSESAHTHSVDVGSTTSSAASNAENRPLFLSCFYIVKIK